MLQILKGEDLENFKQMIKPQIQTLRKFSYGKQITAVCNGSNIKRERYKD